MSRPHSRPTALRRTPRDDTAAEAVRPMAARLQLADRVLPYADRRWRPEDPPAPALHLEDVSAIPFLAGIAGVEEYQHRARLRTAAGDAYAAVTGLRGGLRRLLHAAPAPRPGDPHRGAGKRCLVGPGRGRGLHDRRGVRTGDGTRAPERAARDPPLHGNRAGLATRAAHRRASRGCGHRARAATAGHVAGERQGPLRRARQCRPRSGLDAGDPAGVDGRAPSPPTCARWRRSTPAWV